MSTLLFVYGTLKRGCCNHRQLDGQRFVDQARTAPGYQLHNLGSYPGLVAHADDHEGVTGEVWSVDAAALARLDDFEGVAEGLYRRGPIRLQPPFDRAEVETYLYAQSVAGRAAIGPTWTE